MFSPCLCLVPTLGGRPAIQKGCVPDTRADIYTLPYTCLPNRNDVFRVGQRVRLIFFNSRYVIGSGDISNQIHLLFGSLDPEIGQKDLKTDLKCFDLVWYGLVWPGCDSGSWLNRKHLSNFQKWLS